MREGLRQGAMSGKADTLMRQLHHRFGSVAPTVEQRIRQTEESRLDGWLDRILDAKSLEDVLGDS